MPRLNRVNLRRNPPRPRPKPPRPSPKPPQPRPPNRYYLGIGINYVGTPNQLRGCINDITNSSNFYKNKFPDLQCSFLTDDTVTKPTRENIINQLIRILSISQSGDTIILHYSGHGTNIRDNNKDEKDGKDECIVPIDLRIITDDELNNLLVAHLKPNVFMLGLFDSCFSGTVLDLQYTLVNNSVIVNNNKAQPKGNVILISGCTDNQTSADAYINQNFSGAMTWAFLTCYPSSTNWVSLVENMKTVLKNNRFGQIPLLSYNLNSNTSLL
jgi:hypothetical protein